MIHLWNATVYLLLLLSCWVRIGGKPSLKNCASQVFYSKLHWILLVILYVLKCYILYLLKCITFPVVCHSVPCSRFSWISPCNPYLEIYKPWSEGKAVFVYLRAQVVLCLFTYTILLDKCSCRIYM